MVEYQSGQNGVHVPKHVELELKLEPGLVTIQLHNMAERTVQSLLTATKTVMKIHAQVSTFTLFGLNNLRIHIIAR